MHLTTSLTALALASMALADQAVQITDLGCSLKDGNGNFQFADKAHAIITSSGNRNLICKAQVAAPASGKAVIYSGKNGDGLCNAAGGITDDWQETKGSPGNTRTLARCLPRCGDHGN
ncbi:uncharacterized protein BO66DRAFT_443792 [Aspergillus aculeatinus CBS 121060]|uniref:Uncharacterized protein n=1 Tax=Aspergillus aculeatinus CBS 121060 TaxID=1448322 RepID=A0ACD1GT46_9EURO|nr:hypothetical protein BO66DRAFT_443792 [Aspergillus aculeatinus CBS 121060]RAH64616.1 hypothetical protein BO66DRAFT_443792 [Aspergillus aculeatinus CBS 121060]